MKQIFDWLREQMNETIELNCKRLKHDESLMCHDRNFGIKQALCKVDEAEAKWNTTEAEIRAKAIEEFAEKLGRLCENSAMALDRYNARPLYSKDGKWNDLINDVAEQLKGE